MGDYTIILKYISLLTTIPIKRVGNVWSLTSGIRIEITGSNPQGVVKGDTPNEHHTCIEGDHDLVIRRQD